MTSTNPEGPRPGSHDEVAPLAEVVRSEEQLRVRTRTEVIGRVLVGKRVVSEEVTRTVTLRREELVVEELPAGDQPGTTAAGTATGTLADTAAEEIELVLHEERVVVTSVPVERVRVRVHRVAEEVAVSEVLRRERIAFDVVPTVTTEATGSPTTEPGRQH